MRISVCRWQCLCAVYWLLCCDLTCILMLCNGIEYFKLLEILAGRGGGHSETNFLLFEKETHPAAEVPDAACFVSNLQLKTNHWGLE